MFQTDYHKEESELPQVKHVMENQMSKTCWARKSTALQHSHFYVPNKMTIQTNLICTFKALAHLRPNYKFPYLIFQEIYIFFI